MIIYFIEKHLDSIIKISLVISSALFLIIAPTSIVQYNTPFEYINSLPFYYWIGLALIISNILFVTYFNKQYEPFNISLVISLGLYIVGLPVLVSENPRFHDTYLHGSEAFSIISNGYTEGTYPDGYPLSFILLANSLIISNIPNLTFFKLFELLILLSATLLLYYIARHFTPRYALLAPFAFLGSNWVDKGYFSPQAFALILYITFFLSFYSYYKSKRINWLFITILTSILIIFTNPTNSFILLMNCIIIIATIYTFRYRYHEITNIAILIVVISLGWNLYNAEYYVLKAEAFGEELVSSFGILGKVKLTPAPTEGYDLVNQLRNIISIGVVSTGLLFVLYLFRSKRLDLLIISSILLSTTLFLLITAFTAPFLLGRSFMYITIAWSILLPIFILYISSHTSPKIYFKGLKIGIIFMLVIFLILIPISRYGRDATTYISSSIYNTLYLLSSNSSKYTLIADDPTTFVNKYTQMSLDNKPFESYAITKKIETSIRQDNIEEEVDKIIDLKNKPNAIFVASDFGKNQFILKYDKGDIYEAIEDSYKYTNIIISSGNVRVYSSK